MLPELSIAYVQYAIHWHDWHSNKTDIEFALEKVDGSVDLIVLPEMFASGFTMQPEEVAQSMDGQSLVWMSQLAASRGSHVIGSLVISEEGRFYNRLICAHPEGTFSYYDKRHLFTYAGENEHYAAGKHRLTFEIDGWRICPLVCYDLRFPVWSRNTDDYDVLIYVANWPSARADAWTALLKARAIENLCYVVGLNRVGADANGLAYPGRSEIFDMTGRSVYKSGDHPEVGQTVLQKAPLEEFRARYNFLADKDSFIID